MSKFYKLILAFCSLLFFTSANASNITVIAHDPGFYTSLARHTHRWLKQQNIEADFITPKEMQTKLATSKLAILVGFDSPSQNELQILNNFKSKGGKFIVFYSSSPTLASLMGIKLLGFSKAAYPGQWSCMNFNVNFPTGIPQKIRQTSTVLQRATPMPGKGRVMAVWSDRTGKQSKDAAWISTSAGYWMTHVLLADGDENLKAKLLASLVGCIIPGSWDAVKAEKKENAEKIALRDFASKQVKRKGEIHAVWDHSGCGLYPGDWPRTIKLLKNAGITDLFINVAGAGFAHYPSQKLPQSRTFEQEGDQLKACLNAAQGSGIRVHAWILCFTATRGTPEQLEKFRKNGWRLKSSDGKLTEYLDPSNKSVQSYLLGAIDEILARYKVHGIHLDFVRWYEKSNRPKNAANVISTFVTNARQHVRRPVWLTTAVLGKYPTCIASVGQDWDSWIRTGVVDYVVPMDYSEDMTKFESFLAQHSTIKSHAQRTIVGIGVTANESRLSARQVINQLNLVRKYNLPGVALFDLDQTLETEILPMLKLGMW